MRNFLPLASILLFTSMAAAQSGGSTASCTQILKLAQTTYEQGRLHEVPNLLESCLKREEFSAEESRDAYKLLTQTYIYLEEPEKADAHLILLLRADPFFEIDEAVDPAEFIALYRKFRSKPLFRVGIKGGVNGTFPQLTTHFYAGANNSATAGGYQPAGKYSIGVGPQFGATIERDLFLKNKYRNNWKQRLSAAADLLIFSRTFAYNTPSLFTPDKATLANNDPTPAPGKVDVTVKQQWFDFSPLLQYRLSKYSSTFSTYVTLGPAVSILLDANSTPVTSITPIGGSTNTLTNEVNQENAYKSVVFAAQTGAGFKFRIGKVYVTGEFRYVFGLNKVIDPKKRSATASTTVFLPTGESTSRPTHDAIFDFGFQNNDFKQSNLAANVGFLIPVFSPKKLVR